MTIYECTLSGVICQKSKGLDKGKAVAKTTDGELPTELDFFKYAQGGSSKRKGDGDPRQNAKKVKVDEEGDDETEGVDGGEPSISAPRQRVTAKGNNVPAPVDSFEELKTRYSIPPRLLDNLTQSGYRQPTGIQSHGVPILLEVRVDVASVPTFKLTYTVP